MTQGTHHYVPDERNETILIDVNGEHFPRAEAKVSVFDSGFMLGANVMTEDGVHIRLMVTRGVRSTPYQDPRGPTTKRSGATR